jgi:hypothetical protein
VYNRSQWSESHLRSFSCLQSCNTLEPNFSHMSNIHIALLRHLPLKNISCLEHKNFRMKAMFHSFNIFLHWNLKEPPVINLLSKYSDQITLSVHEDTHPRLFPPRIRQK